MHWARAYLGLAALGVVGIAALTAPADASVCSVFRHRPCAPTYCSPFSHHPCRPFYGFPLGENLQLTITSPSAENASPEQKAAASQVHSDHAAGPDEHTGSASAGQTGEAPAVDAQDSGAQDSGAHDAGSQGGDTHDIDNIHGMFAALRSCWQPPPQDQAREGMQMSVRFSFTHDGKLKGPPRITYILPGVSDETKQVYAQSIKDTLDRCTPMPFTAGMAGAIAGRPIAVRFIDNRKPTEEHP
jgi:hypothetical protein